MSTTAEETTSDLAQLKALYALASAKMKRLDTPQQEIQELCNAIKDAAVTNRMGSEPEFAKWINDEVGIGLMQKMAKTNSYDQNVSALTNRFRRCLTPVYLSTSTYART